MTAPLLRPIVTRSVSEGGTCLDSPSLTLRVTIPSDLGTEVALVNQANGQRRPDDARWISVRRPMPWRASCSMRCRSSSENVDSSPVP